MTTDKNNSIIKISSDELVQYKNKFKSIAICNEETYESEAVELVNKDNEGFGTLVLKAEATEDKKGLVLSPDWINGNARADVVYTWKALAPDGYTDLTKIENIKIEDDKLTILDQAQLTSAITVTAIAYKQNIFVAQSTSYTVFERGITPTIAIDTENNQWIINEEPTGIPVTGDPGHTPVITIGANGNWFIDGNDTYQKAQGETGKDGANIEYVYYRSKTENSNLTAPKESDIQSQPSSVDDTMGDKWYPSPLGITDTWKYEYVSIRTKPAGVNTNWTSFSTPVIWSKWGDKGQDGDGVSYEYYLKNDETPPTYDASDEKWTDEPTGVSKDDKYEYVVQIKTTTGEDGKTKVEVSDAALWAKWSEDGAQGLQGLQGIQGEQGIPGKDGTSSYFHIKYSENNNGNPMTETPSTYIGTYVDNIAEDSSDYTKYTWSRFEGIPGTQGIPGNDGQNGKTSYLHIAYANSSDGSIGFDIVNSVGKLYIGQYTDFTQDDSKDPTKYKWTLIKGADGRAIKEVKEEYARNNNKNQVPTSWSTTLTPPDKQNLYLWNRETIIYNDNTQESTTTPVIIAYYTEDGKGISAITNYYQLRSDENTPSQPTGTPGATTAPQVDTWYTSTLVTTPTNKYLWNCEKITYTDGSSVYTNPARIGTHGSQGESGSNFRTFTTTYETDQETMEIWAALEDEWQVSESTSGVKPNDTVLYRCKNTTKNGYSYIMAIVLSVPTDRSIYSKSVGLIDKGDAGPQGTSPYLIELSNDSATIGTNKDGTGIDLNALKTATLTTATVWQGDTDISAKCTFYWELGANEGSLNKYQSRTVYFTGLSDGVDTARAIVRARITEDKTEIGSKVLTVTKNKQGEPGTSAVTYILSASPNSWNKTENQKIVPQFTVTKYDGGTASNMTAGYTIKTEGKDYVTNTPIEKTTTFDLYIGTVKVDSETVTAVANGANSTVPGPGIESETRLYKWGTDQPKGDEYGLEYSKLLTYESYKDSGFLWMYYEQTWTNDKAPTYTTPIRMTDYEMGTLMASLELNEEGGYGISISEWCKKYKRTLIDGSTVATGGLIAETIQSGNYIKDQSGFKITSDTANNNNLMIDSKKFKVTYDGEITAKKGTIAGWEVNQRSFSKGDVGSPSSFVMDTGDYGLGGQVAGHSTDGNEDEPGWSLAVGQNFGVTSDGSLYAQAANISGTVAAERGHIGAFEIKNNGLESQYVKLNAQSIEFPSQSSLILSDDATLGSNENEVYINSLGNKSFIIRNAQGAGIQFYPVEINEGTGCTLTLTLVSANFNKWEEEYYTEVRNSIDGYNGETWYVSKYDFTPSMTFNYQWSNTPNYVPDIIITVQYYLRPDSNSSYERKTHDYTISIPNTRKFGSITIEEQVYGAMSENLDGYKVWSGGECSQVILRPKEGNSVVLYEKGTIYYPSTTVYSTFKERQNLMLFSLGSFCPISDAAKGEDGLNLGNGSYMWDTVSAINTNFGSDRNIKKDIVPLNDERYSILFDELKPSIYKFKAGTSQRNHTGFIAQEVKDALDMANIDSKDFAAYCDYEQEDGTHSYSLRYNEFIPLNTWQIQKLKARVKQAEETIELQDTYIKKLEERIEKLEQKLL